MLDLIRLLSQYELLRVTAQHLSALDLYNLALTSSTFYDLVRTPDVKFQALRKHCLCDGRGVKARRKYKGDHDSFTIFKYDYNIGSHNSNLRCLESETLPCTKCGLNVCEECRDYPRTVDQSYGPCRRPHANTPFQTENIVCYCEACEVEMSKKVTGGDCCKCDRYTRWVCRKCASDEKMEAGWYDRHWTQHYSGGGPEEAEDGMMLRDHQHERLVCKLRLLSIRIINCRAVH